MKKSRRRKGRVIRRIRNIHPLRSWGQLLTRKRETLHSSPHLHSSDHLHLVLTRKNGNLLRNLTSSDHYTPFFYIVLCIWAELTLFSLFYLRAEGVTQYDIASWNRSSLGGCCMCLCYIQFELLPIITLLFLWFTN